MKKLATIFKVITSLMLIGIFLQSCLKDKVTRTYTIHTPVYKTITEVRENIRSNTAVAVKNTGKLFVLGNYIFLNEVDKGIHVIDNSNPSAPVNKYFINIPGNIDMAVKGNILYADMYEDFVAIDISDPTNVKVKKFIENAFPYRRYAPGFVPDTMKVIVDWVIKDTTVTVERDNPILFATRGSFALASSMDRAAAPSGAVALGVSGSMARFSLLDNYLYTVTTGALNVFNISNPEQPIFSNTVNLVTTSGWNIETIYPFKNNLFIGSSDGMLIYGTSNPAHPNKLGSFTHARACDPVVADDKYAYVTLRSGTRCNGFNNQLDVVDVSNLNSPTFVKSYSLTNPHGLSKDGNILFICDGKGGLKTFDATNAKDIRLLQTIDGIEPFDVITINGLAIVVSKEGLIQYDYSDPAKLKFLSKLSLNQ